jgi:hypothetical protein
LGKFGSLLSGIILSLRGNEQINKDTGRNKLMMYSRATGKTEYLLRIGGQEINAPVMSTDNANIALLGCTDSLCHLYTYHIDTKQLAELNTGRNLKTPHWLNNHELLYINNGQLWYADIVQHNTHSVFDSIKIERILTMYSDEQGIHHLVYQAQDPHILGKNEVYLLLFDRSFGFLSNGMLPNNPNIYAANAISKANGGVVLSEEMPEDHQKLREIGIYFLDKQQKLTKKTISSKDGNYYDPRWSPDGNFITFVSDTKAP